MRHLAYQNPTHTKNMTVHGQTMPNSKNLLDTAAAKNSFKTFGKAVGQAGLTDTLLGRGQFTVFAPTDAAVAKLPADTLDRRRKPQNNQQLASILAYPVAAGRSSAAEVGKLKTSATVNGHAAPIVLDGDMVSIDGAQVTHGKYQGQQRRSPCNRQGRFPDRHAPVSATGAARTAGNT